MVNFVQAMAAAMGGERQAADLAGQNQAIQANQIAIKQAQQQQAASSAWGKAIADILASSGQTAPQPPVAPQPGQPSVPGGGSQAPMPMGAPQGGAPPGIQAQAAPAAPIQPPQSPFASTGALSPGAILQQIQKDNPNLDPGVLSAIVDNHLMPLMSQQQQSNFAQAKQMLDFQKMTLDQQDKVQGLLLKYMDLQDKMQLGTMSIEERAQAAADRAAISGAIVGIRQEMAQSTLMLQKSEMDRNEADAAKLRQDAIDKQNAVATGGKKIEQEKADINQLQQKTQQAIRMIRSDPYVVGVIGKGKGWWQTAVGDVQTLLGDTPKNDPKTASVSQFAQLVTDMQLQLDDMRRRGRYSEAYMNRLDQVVQGLADSDTATTAITAMSSLYTLLEHQKNDLPGTSAATPSPTQVDPTTNTTIDPTATAPKSTPVGAVKAWKGLDGTVKIYKKVKSGPDDNEETWKPE